MGYLDLACAYLAASFEVFISDAGKKNQFL